MSKHIDRRQNITPAMLDALCDQLLETLGPYLDKLAVFSILYFRDLSDFESYLLIAQS
jgi:hypothetical protein